MSERTPKAGPILSVRELRKYYPVRGGIFGGHRGDVKAVESVSFHLEAGETLG
ncbi:MAG: peptide ABC transporter substrate-binding protein, partial [Gemmatimonadetes bacterium]|nr:peptide ABC transporter substrate-binding protein [Gemmatimonadota bacterium]